MISRQVYARYLLGGKERSGYFWCDIGHFDEMLESAQRLKWYINPSNIFYNTEYAESRWPEEAEL